MSFIVDLFVHAFEWLWGALKTLICVKILKRIPPTTRTIYCNDSRKTQKEFKYKGNYVRTTKYRWYTFVIQNILEQFMRIANLYFLLISILQVFTPWSPTGRWGTVTPLILFMGITLIKDGIEDLFRSFSDVKMNNTSAQVLRNGMWKSVAWKNIKVGDIVKTMSEKQFPCDMVLLHSTEPQSLCYIQTASLDGETNLKNRQGVAQTAHMKESDFDMFEGSIECELPNERLYEFTGNITINGNTYPVAPENILLRGAVLRNTEYTLGVCIFAGTDTKLMQNSKETPHKVSKIERTTNYMILLLFAFIIFVATTCVVGWGIWLFVFTRPEIYQPQWYVWWQYKFVGMDIIAACVTFFVLFNNFIPISLYVTMELTKVWQAVVWINNDAKMFYDDGNEGKPARVKTASLVEELGQVEYVFSDKTGTLTQNKMEFLKFAVNGKGYGRGTTEIGRAAAVRRGEVLEDDRPKDWSPEADGFQFYDPAISKLAYRKDKNGKEIENFFKFLGVCHTVIPEPDKKNGGIFYNAASPDEGALVKAAKYMGFEFTKRTHDTISYQDPDGKEHTVKILNILEFNSTRKRMSIIFRDEDGTIRVYCKGADSVIWKLMSKESQHEKETNELLDKFGGEGLRTLLCAERILDEKVWKDWDTNYWQPAIKDLSKDKKDKVADAAAMMETDLHLVGATAIEDKLQDGVPSTISTLQNAGIKVWVLTGDKQETAINIGYACAMLDNDMYKIILNDRKRSTLKKKIDEEMINLKSKLQNEKETDFGVIVDGDTLSVILNWDKKLKNVYLEDGEELRISFLKLCMLCKSVICCRVSPLQKSQVVQLVKMNLGDVITLAIGDGANDVSMIQAAHIGVGISGEEGEQASRSADFAIAQFRFLQRLLLVHGRYAYRRIAKLILYFFYKNATVQFTQFYYVFFNGFSGTSLFDNQILSLYNVIWTSLPVLGLSFFDKDLSTQTSEDFPELYILGQRSYYFNVPRFILWFLNAVYHSAICFFVPQLALEYSMLGNLGHTITHRMMGTLIMGCVIIVVTLKLGIEVANWNPVFILIVLFTIFVYPVILFIYHILAPLTIWITPIGFKNSFESWTGWLSFLKGIISGATSFHDGLFIIFGGLRQSLVAVWFEIYDMVQFPAIWLTLLIVIVLCLFKDILMKGFARVFCTRLYHSLQETRSDKATRDYITSKYSSLIDSMHPPKRAHHKKWYQFIINLVIKPSGLIYEEVEDNQTGLIDNSTSSSNVINQTNVDNGEELQEIKIDGGDQVHVKVQQEDHHGFAFNQTENQTALLNKYTEDEVQVPPPTRQEVQQDVKQEEDQQEVKVEQEEQEKEEQEVKVEEIVEVNE